ncbi:secreted protein [gut metagenome]|uniref:Secreted protein n=1 Tax=gut metagenome TaxID=749906 RepID=J9FP72_9ZZZZ
MIFKPSRTGRITFSTLSSAAILSLNAAMPRVCLSCGRGSCHTLPSHNTLSAMIYPPGRTMSNTRS